MNEDSEITIADVIIDAMPFSDQLNDWCQIHPNFKAGLKFTNADHFLPIGAVLISYPKNSPSDQVVGFLVYDMDKKYFKQDYILNIGGADTDFVLYAKVPGKMDDAQVKHIKQFFAKYDSDGDYESSHHLSIEQVEAIAEGYGKPFLAKTAHRAIEIANGIRRTPTQQELVDVRAKIRAEKGVKQRG